MNIQTSRSSSSITVKPLDLNAFPPDAFSLTLRMLLVANLANIN